MGTAAGTVLGTNYPKLWLGGLFGVGGTAILPADGTGRFGLTFPFAIRDNSFLFGFTDSARNGPAVFTLNLSGSGIATMTTTRVPSFNPSDPALYDTRSVSFDFANSPSPTPEPASILLFGSAIAIMARAARRRGSRS